MIEFADLPEITSQLTTQSTKAQRVMDSCDEAMGTLAQLKDQLEEYQEKITEAIDLAERLEEAIDELESEEDILESDPTLNGVL